MVTIEPHPAEESSMLQVRLAEAEGLQRAIRVGEIDAFVVETPGGSQVFTLHSAEEPYRLLIEQMQEGALVLTGAGDILYANVSFAALVGEPLEAVVGSRIDRFVEASDKDDVAALLSRGSGRCRSRLVGPGSERVEVSLSLTTTKSQSGDRLNLIVMDLSDLREAHNLRDRAVSENHSKDEFITTLAHELRNPLSAITGAARLLEVTRDAVRLRARAHEVIARQIDHISHLINDLLDVERVASGKLRLNRQPVDIEASIRGVVNTFTCDTTLDRRITISTEPVWVEWDAVRFQQVLTNIMTNAVKYSPSGGQIRVVLRAEGGDAVLSVEDTGFGISPALLPFVFDKYMQVDRTLDHAQSGLGIGLALVRRLVELHGGTVAASSEGEGRGSTFTVRLKQVAAPGDAVPVSVPQERRATPRRVLLIEDSGDARERLRMTLERAGHLVYDAADVERGLELLKTVRADVGIIDISARPVDRSRVARRFRQARHGRNMVLVALGLPASPSPASGASKAKDGFDFHVAKPVDDEYLARLLGGAIRARSAQ